MRRSRSRPRQHVRKLKSGKKILVNNGIHKKKKFTKKKSFFKKANDFSAKDKKADVSQSYLSIVSELKKGGRARVSELGVFSIKKKPAKKARKGINPFTKQPMMFKAKPASKVVKFRPSKRLKESLL